MLTYQLHTRALKLKEGKKLVFPAKVVLELEFAPGTAFGTEDKPSRTLVRGHEATITINANTGRWVGQSKPPLDPIDVTVSYPDSEYKLQGSTFTYEFQCADIAELEGTLIVMKWVYPTLLNLGFSDPPVVLSVGGRVGDVKFEWIHRREEWRIQMQPITLEGLEQHAADSFEKLPLFNGYQNRRLAAALSYFHAAVRLNVCGDSPWEFMAETVLNYAKTLDILFVTSEDSRDDIRRELKVLGYTADEAEGDFVPLLILRSFVDVAHPKVSLFRIEDLKVLYRYVAQSENRMRDLLRRVVERVSKGEYSFPEERDLRLSDKDRSGMNELVATMNSRLRVIARS